MAHIVFLITSYLNTQNNYLYNKIHVLKKEDYISITCNFRGIDLDIRVYNETFIKIRVDELHFAICDGIKSFRDEFDRLAVLRYEW